MGDVVFSIPALEGLARTFPQARVDVLVLPYTAPLLRTVPVVGKVHELDVNAYRRWRGWPSVSALLASIGKLRSERYDLAVGLSGRMGGVFAVLCGARWRLGYGPETYSGCYQLGVDDCRYRRPVHEVDYCLDLLGVLGIDSGQPVQTASDASSALPAGAARPSLPREGWPPLAVDLEPSSPYVVLVPGASNGRAKRWPTLSWGGLGDRLSRELGLRIVLCGGQDEGPLGREIARAMREPVQDLIGWTSVPKLAGVLLHASLVVAGDTGPLHLAAALGTPVVGIFGPTDPVNTGPLGEYTAALRLGLPCSPCYDLRSPAECKLPDKSVICMVQLPVNRVFDAARDLLTRTSSEAPVPSSTP
jgi:lipopolysaccharide heptosyltransferase II